MSRAFVKEPEGDQAQDGLPERPLSPHPNYITPGGFRQLQSHLQALLQKRDELRAQGDDLSAKSQLGYLERELRYLAANIERAIIIDPKHQSHEDIRFGARASVMDEANKRYQFTIVGEEEACAPKGYISWLSPLAQALLGKRAGDRAVWERPVGNTELEILSFEYPED
jgi:transcription elongation factor GreB